MFGATDPLIYQYYDTISEGETYTEFEDPFYGMDLDTDDELDPYEGFGFSFMDTDDEGEFYDPSETGGYAVDLEDL